MHKLLLSLFFISCMTSTYGQYIPTRSERSGNGITPDGAGYVCNFGSDKADNCYANETTTDNYNQFHNVNYTCDLNTTLGHFNFSFNGSQTATDNLVNHFSYKNCQLIDSRPEGPVDMSDVNNQWIEFKVRANVTVEKFGAYIGVVDQNGFFQLGNSPANTTAALVSNEWTTVRIPAIFENDYGIIYDPSKVIGIALYAKNTADPQPNGMIEIDYIRLGSAASSSIASGFVSPTGNGYTFGFEGDEFHTCLDQLNVSGNANFDYQVDLTNDQLLITQADANISNDIFSVEFTDQDCFLATVDLSVEENRIAQIKITSDQDVPSIGIALMGRFSDNSRIYSDVLATFSLSAGVEKTISVPLSFANALGNLIGGAHVNGIGFIVDPASNIVLRKGAREQIAPVHYTIDYLKIGDVAGPVTSIVPSINTHQLFSIYPNPTQGQVYLQLLDIPSQEYSIVVSDYTGQLINSYSETSTAFNLDLSSYKQGMYLIKMISGSSVYTEKVILK
ncbi:MAG: T9SS type A sorting domain-containing protein [Cytophagaceae bacterium]|nr:T9SS type A sorting domain-containing protein [Cytophagaceae bacterium]